MLTAAALITRVNQIVGAPNYVSQGLDGLNIVLGDLCEDYDFALARGEYSFNFNPALTSMFGSGPYPLPLDYLRTSGSSGAEGQTKSAWFLYPAPAFPMGQPMQLVPVDLGRFDQYPQLNAQGIPGVIATDMGGPLTQRITCVTPAVTTAGSTMIYATLAPGIAAGQGVAGEGITPGTTVVSVSTALVTTCDTNSTTTLSNIPSTAEIQIGDIVTAANIVLDSTGAPIQVQTIVDAQTVTISFAATSNAVGEAVTFAHSGAIVILSEPATATSSLASVFFGIAPVCYVYPPPIGSWPVTIRYQRKMPPIVDLARVPWFPNESYLVERMAASQMQITGDTRLAEFEGIAKGRLQRYIDLVDDKTNRAQTIQMDAGRYGRGSFGRLKNTKVAGW